MPLQAACQVCGPRAGVAPESLFKCSRCQAVLYCGREHQTTHFPAHKALCRRIKKMRDLMEQEAHEVRNADEDGWTPANAFETHAGNFWKIHSTRPYMSAKMDLIRGLSAIPSRPAIEAALAETKGCLRLCRSDNVGVREVVPTLLLLLGQYQEAYDYIKWYQTSGQDEHYDWANMELPYLDVHGADMTEELPGRIRDVFFMSILVYVKMTLANTVKEAVTAYELADRASLPTVVTDSLGAFLAPSGNMRSLDDLKELHKKLTRQLTEAFSLAHSKNKHFWGVMLDPAPLIQAPDPSFYSPGDKNEVRVWAEQNAMLWADHHEFIREYRGKMSK
ncbi:hypothetical protein PR003_g4341 [Phytophthora rubi]|uniref:MYND-type domain-containing protein n=1 Tax=Phytophthora rubi TaxID=129364 RepID=A0A6A3NNF4_9STRA|nr:hypothetical protein PR002_g2582 [Phytophthora rubi]KAE9047700.1 hypothetical protein PR001_g4094 [Phytophthora rubi]KAE9352517.1 hypothetical protein PR003_g4341 [Phytophthora rubi]